MNYYYVTFDLFHQPLTVTRIASAFKTMALGRGEEEELAPFALRNGHLHETYATPRILEHKSSSKRGRTK